MIVLPSHDAAGRPHSDMSPVVAVGGTLAVAGVALSAALLRLSGAHRKRVRSIKGVPSETKSQLDPGLYGLLTLMAHVMGCWRFCLLAVLKPLLA